MVYNRISFLYVVNVRLNHQGNQADLKMLWDTDAAYTAVSGATFERLGVKSDNRKIAVTFGSGDDNAVSGSVETMVLDGTISVNNIQIIVCLMDSSKGNLTCQAFWAVVSSKTSDFN